MHTFVHLGKKKREEREMGRIHSVETFGTVDGPGVRFVVFFQGCPMRCQYCHNPDTWRADAGEEMSGDELLSRFERNRSFYKTGGITATGGEPMMQTEFLTELFIKAKERGIHTCLDTSGILFPGTSAMAEASDQELLAQIDALLAVTDLVMLDIKHMGAKAHRSLTGHGNENVLAFAKYLDEKKKDVWIRHVVVPGITFDETELTELGRFLTTLSNVEKLEVLPYHALGSIKYERLGMDYVLKDTPQLTREQAKEAERIIRAAWSKPEAAKETV